MCRPCTTRAPTNLAAHRRHAAACPSLSCCRPPAPRCHAATCPLSVCCRSINNVPFEFSAIDSDDASEVAEARTWCQDCASGELHPVPGLKDDGGIAQYYYGCSACGCGSGVGYVGCVGKEMLRLQVGKCGEPFTHTDAYSRTLRETLFSSSSLLIHVMPRY
eukprot:270768-Chlamydomonas_euryale.AAC.1